MELYESHDDFNQEDESECGHSFVVSLESRIGIESRHFVTIVCLPRIPLRCILCWSSCRWTKQQPCLYKTQTLLLQQKSWWFFGRLKTKIFTVWPDGCLQHEDNETHNINNTSHQVEPTQPKHGSLERQEPEKAIYSTVHLGFNLFALYGCLLQFLWINMKTNKITSTLTANCVINDKKSFRTGSSNFFFPTTSRQGIPAKLCIIVLTRLRFAGWNEWNRKMIFSLIFKLPECSPIYDKRLLRSSYEWMNAKA